MRSTVQPDAILNCVADGVFTIDDNWEITSFNKAAEKITHFSAEEVIGKKCSDIFKTTICTTDCAFKDTIEHGTEIVNKKIKIHNKFGEQLPVTVSTSLLKDENGKTIGGVETFRDIASFHSVCKAVTESDEKEPQLAVEGEADKTIQYQTKLSERFTIINTLEKNRWNRKKTAKELNIHLTTLWRKMKRYNIE